MWGGGTGGEGGPDPRGRGGAARGARVADRGHHRARRCGQRPGKRAAALFRSARPRVPGSRRESSAPAAPSRPGRHRVGASMTAWTERRYAVIDVDGNGQHPPDLVELAAAPTLTPLSVAPL